MKRTVLFYKIEEFQDPVKRKVADVKKDLARFFKTHPQEHQMENNLYVETLSNEKTHFFASIGKMGEDRIGTFERGRKKSNPSEESELIRNDDKFIEKYTFFYIDYDTQIMCVLNNSDCPITIVSGYVYGFINEDRKPKYTINPIVNDKIDEILEKMQADKIKLKFSSPQAAELASIKELANELVGVKEITLSLKMQKGLTIFNKHNQRFIEKIPGLSGLSEATVSGTFENDETETVINLLEKSLTKSIKVEIPYPNPQNADDRKKNAEAIMEAMRESISSYVVSFY